MIKLPTCQEYAALTAASAGTVVWDSEGYTGGEYSGGELSSIVE